MSKTRFTPWIVLACIGTLAGCTSGEGGTAGNTELNIMIPTGGGSFDPDGNPVPADFDIEVVEYTVNCDATPPTASDFPGIDSIEPGAGKFEPDVTINGALEVFDTAVPGNAAPDFGPGLTQIYVGQAFMDIPKDAVCSVQLRARDGDGEVICTKDEDFDTKTVAVGGVVSVNVLMYCGVSFQAPVADLDLGGDFSFNIANFCPDLFVLNCIDPDLEELLVVPGLGAFVYSGCQVRFRDGDKQCGTACDPQSCDMDAKGLTCTPGPDPRAPITTVSIYPAVCAPGGVPGPLPCTLGDPSACDGNPKDCLPIPSFFCAIPNPALFGTPCTPGDTNPASCDGIAPGACAPSAVLNCGGAGAPTLDPACQFAGDTLGAIGDAPPSPLDPGTGGFLVGCTVADDDGDSATPPVALAPGATVQITAYTTDNDWDCDKVKTAEVECPGLTPCQAAPPGFCDDGNDCTADSCDDSSGVAVCSSSNVADGTTCTSAPAPASCLAGVCVSSDCNAQPDPDGSCDDGNECTTNTCDAPPATTCSAAPNTGTACAGNTGVCDAGGACVDNCFGVDPDDGNPCTDDSTDSSGGACTIINTPNDANACTTCGGGSCICSGGSCIVGCTVPAPVDAPGIPMACRNSFNQAVSTFPIDLLNVTANSADGCIHDATAVDFDIDPTIALDTAFLQAAAETLCDLGTLLTVADVTTAQVRIDAVAGATCTSELSVLTPVPQTVVIDITLVSGSCGAGGVVVVNSGISLPLAAVNLACTAGAIGTDSLQICSTGQVPLNITLATPIADTYVGVSVGGGAIQVAFQCNTSSTTSPAPGVTVSCTAPNPAGECAVLPPGNVGETPFPVGDCDFGDGFPGECETVPVGVDPATVCAIFSVED